MNVPNKSGREFGELLSMTLAMFQERIGVVIGGILFLSFVPALVFIPAGFVIAMSKATFDPANPDFTKLLPVISTVGICGLVYFILYNVFRTGWVAICLKITKGVAAAFSEMFTNFQYVLNFILAHILMGIVVTIGLVFLIIPGIFVGIKLCFTPFLIIDQNMGPLDAMKGSWEMTEGYFWKIFLSGLAYMVINIIGGFIPLLGIAVQVAALGFLDLLITSLYRDKKGDLVAPN